MSRVPQLDAMRARVDRGAGDVGYEVEPDHNQSQQHHPVLDHQSVAIGDRLQHEPAQSWQDEHVLDHDRARNQIGEL